MKWYSAVSFSQADQNVFKHKKKKKVIKFSNEVCAILWEIYNTCPGPSPRRLWGLWPTECTVNLGLNGGESEVPHWVSVCSVLTFTPPRPRVRRVSHVHSEGNRGRPREVTFLRLKSRNSNPHSPRGSNAQASCGAGVGEVREEKAFSAVNLFVLLLRELT